MDKNVRRNAEMAKCDFLVFAKNTRVLSVFLEVFGGKFIISTHRQSKIRPVGPESLPVLLKLPIQGYPIQVENLTCSAASYFVPS